MTGAQLLECPDCQHRQDLNSLGDVETFLCQGCRRPLKVPAVLRTPKVATASDATAVMGRVDSNAEMPSAPAAQEQARTQPPSSPTGRIGTDEPVVIGMWIRLLIWVVAVPLGLAIVFKFGQALGFVTSQQLLDTFAAKGWNRFAPIARLLPFAALLIAAIVQASVAGLERRAKALRRGSLSVSPDTNPGPGSGSDRVETRDVR